MSGTTQGSSPARLCLSWAHSVKCEPDELAGLGLTKYYMSPTRSLHIV